MTTISTFLMFDDQAGEAVELYTSLFADSRVIDITRAGGHGEGEADQVVSATFQLAGQTFMAFNGGPYFSFSEGMSIFVSCEGQDEVDRLWSRLSEGGEESQCGWLKDRFGVSWQIIPKTLGDMLADPDPEKAERVRQAMLKMGKIIIRDLEHARDGGQTG